MKQADIDIQSLNGLFQRSFRYNQIFGWKLFEWIRNRYERTIGESALEMNPLVKSEKLYE